MKKELIATKRKLCRDGEEVGNGEGWDAWPYYWMALDWDSALPCSSGRWLGRRGVSRWGCRAGSRRSGRGRTSRQA